MLSLSNAVFNHPGTMIFKESTPNGVGNYFLANAYVQDH
jgi:hypothetical protein